MPKALFFENVLITRKPSGYLGQFYQNQVAKSMEKYGIVQKIDFKVRHQPQNPNFVLKIFSEFAQNQ